MDDLNRTYFLARTTQMNGEKIYAAGWGRTASPHLYPSAGIAKAANSGWQNKSVEIVEVRIVPVERS